MHAELETTRLILKTLALGDGLQIQKLFPRWKVLRYKKPHKTPVFAGCWANCLTNA